MKGYEKSYDENWIDNVLVVTMKGYFSFLFLVESDK